MIEKFLLTTQEQKRIEIGSALGHFYKNNFCLRDGKSKIAHKIYVAVAKNVHK